MAHFLQDRGAEVNMKGGSMVVFCKGRRWVTRTPFGCWKGANLGVQRSGGTAHGVIKETSYSYYPSQSPLLPEWEVTLGRSHQWHPSFGFDSILRSIDDVISYRLFYSELKAHLHRSETVCGVFNNHGCLWHRVRIFRWVVSLAIR